MRGRFFSAIIPLTMREIISPEPIVLEGRAVFLAGSIEEGAAAAWQRDVVAALADADWTVLTPRRRNWDPTWEQRADKPEFRSQVEWELAGQERADAILLYFDPATRSPVSLLELGLFARSGKLLVVCPEGYWRKGNVDIACERYGVRQFATLEEAVAALRATSPKT